MKKNIILASICVLLIAVYAIAQNNNQPAQPSPNAQPPMQPLQDPVPAASAQPSVAAAQPSATAAQTPAVAAQTPAMAAQPSVAAAQPSPAAPAPVQSGALVDPSTAAAPAVPAVPATPAGALASPSPAATPAVATVGAVPPSPQNEIRLNFQNASLTDVLNYLSEAAGFVIVQETPVSGTVNVISRQPVNANEAVDLLNSVLYEKGYTAIRNGRILKIVSSHDAQTHDLPVMVTSNPDEIPRNDAKVTQILPIRYMDATKLIDNLRPLLATDAAISSNESSNAIILTDTQANIHRMAEIIHALDTSISSISTIRVFPLRYADAKDFASVLTQLFSPDQASTSRNGQNQPQIPAFFRAFGGGGGGGGGGRGGGGGGGGNADAQSEARKAASRVVAVADEQSNSVVVSAPDEYMVTIADIVNRLDTSTTDITETRIFRLEHADSVELSTILNSLYGDPSTVSQTPNRNGQPNNNQQRPNNNNNNNNAARPVAAGASERTLLQARVVAVPDPRTNTIIVNASRDTMEQIALTIGRLDATDSKKQHVYVHVLEHADPDNVATILRGMFGDTTSTSSTSSQPSSSLLNQRTTSGASSDVTGTLNTTGNSGGGGGSNGRSGGGFQ